MGRVMDHVTSMMRRRRTMVDHPVMHRVVNRCHTMTGNLRRRGYREHHAKSHQAGNQ